MGWMENLIRERRERKERELFDRGFAWVCLRYMRYDESLDYLEDQIDQIDHAIDRNSFDEGARQGIASMRTIETTLRMVAP